MRKLLAKASLKLLRPDRLAAYQQVQKSQWSSPVELTRIQQGKLTRLLTHVAGQVPFYQEYFAQSGAAAGEIELGDLSALPLVDKKIMIERERDFIAANAASADLLPSATGGSTGTWFQFYSDPRTVVLSRAIDMRCRTWAGWEIGDKQAVLWGHSKDVKALETFSGRLRNFLFNRSITLNAYDMDEQKLQEYAQALVSFQPVMLMGYASALAFLAEYMGQQNIAAPRIRGVISCAETLTAEQRDIIEAYFGCPVFNRYGSREFGTIAQQCEKVDGLHVSSEHLLLEILDPDGKPCAPGEQGEIVVTDLDSHSMPFIRYRIGDLAVPSNETCSCGRGLPLLAEVSGRVSEVIVGVNGKYYSCQSPRLFGADIPGIGQMQIVQEVLEEIEVVVAPNELWSADGEQKLVERMRHLLGEVRVKVTLVDHIPPAPSGKYRFTISKVSPFERR